LQQRAKDVIKKSRPELADSCREILRHISVMKRNKLKTGRLFDWHAVWLGLSQEVRDGCPGRVGPVAIRPCGAAFAIKGAMKQWASLG
jgi:hypothetical protein